MKSGKFKKRIFIAALFLSIALSLQFILSTEAIAGMFGILKKYDVHLSPEVYGRVLLKGKPLSNVTVFRSLTYGDDDEILDKVKTDNQGYFSFNEKNIQSRKPGSMFDESSVRQIIDLDYGGKRYLLWGTITIGIKPNKALSDKLKNLNCDLENSETYVEFSSIEYPQASHGVNTICRWSH